MKEIIINCKLETLEDFHIGSGLSDLGMCDEGVVKDEQGRPTIPASTFKGLLRQSSLEFEESMKLFGDTSYDNLKNFIFDFGGKNSIDISCELDRVSLGLTPFLYHTFTEINSNTRKASDKSLRTIEAVSKGTCFLIKISFRITDKEFIDKSDIIVEYLTYGLKSKMA